MAAFSCTERSIHRMIAAWEVEATKVVIATAVVVGYSSSVSGRIQPFH